MKKVSVSETSSPLARGVVGGTRRGVAKKLIISIMCVLGIATAYATGENERATSVGYVTEELTTRQDKFNKLGADTAMTYSGTTDGAVGSRTITGDLGAETNTGATTLPTVGGVNTKLANQQDELNLPADTVLVNTGIAGEPAAKGIYDDSGDYNSQTDSLIDAATFNAALQNAINSEFTCAQRKDPNDPTSKCLLFNIFAPTQNRIIPAEYTRLEYLESTGEQYIDTGITADPSIVVDMQVLFNRISRLGVAIGTRNGTNTYDGNIFEFGSYHESPTFFNRYGEGFVEGETMYADTLYDVHLENNYQKISYGMNNIVTTHKFRPTMNTLGTLYLFAVHDLQLSVTFNMLGYIAYCKIYKNGALVRNFIPAKRNSDGVLGMYDTVSGTFFTNAGTGTFIAGPELSSNIYLPMN